MGAASVASVRKSAELIETARAASSRLNSGISSNGINSYFGNTLQRSPNDMKNFDASENTSTVSAEAANRLKTNNSVTTAQSYQEGQNDKKKVVNTGKDQNGNVLPGIKNENKIEKNNASTPNLNSKVNQPFVNTSSILPQNTHFPLKRASNNLNPYAVPNDTAPLQSINIKLTHIGE
jgi:hypothetical protein